MHCVTPFQLCELFHSSCALQISKRSPGHFSEFVKRVWCSFSCSWWLVASSAGSGWPAGHSKGIVSLPPSRRSVTVAGGAGVQQQQPAGTTIGGWHYWRWLPTRRRQSVDQRERRRGATRTRVGGRHQPRSPGGGSWCIGEAGAGGECPDAGGGTKLTPETPIPHIFQISRSHSSWQQNVDKILNLK